ncbi:MAG: Mur ligase family protein [Vicingaceae bacterium]
MKVHFIAIGGSAMHNMAIALHKKGYEVSGSDDEIFEPSKSRLAKHNLLPKKVGWQAEKINDSYDAIILGMHAKPDNPELLKAQELGLKIYSYPEYIYEQAKDKQRFVIAGSHGKTSITAMVMHVLKKAKLDFDYMVGAQLEGFDTMVRLSDAPIIIIEGDEYLSSPIDRRPKFFWYKPQFTVISGIAWDHINVFPTFENYLDQFKQYLASLPEDAEVYYYQGDEMLGQVVNEARSGLKKLPYQTHAHKNEAGKTILKTPNEEVPVLVFGSHNLQNLSAAKSICMAAGVDESTFYQAIQSFKGAAKRLELIAGNEDCLIYKDYAHSPSKLKATTQAVKNQFEAKKVIAVMELHTFSSLNKDFLSEYSGCMSAADEAVVYFNPKAIEHKGLDMIQSEDVAKAFLPSKVNVFDDSAEVKRWVEAQDLKNSVLLLMTSGNFDGINLNEWADQLVKS